MNKKRVVVTGLGIVLPGSYNVESAWDKVINGKSFISKINGFDTSDCATKIAGEIKWAPEMNVTGVPKIENVQYPSNEAFIYENLFDPSNVLDKKEIRRMDKFIIYVMHATDQAVKDAGLEDLQSNLDRVGVLVGSGIGGLTNIEDNVHILTKQGPRRISPFFLPSVLINLLSGQISIKYGYQGPNFSIVSACATSAHSIGEGARAILCDDADVMIVGGSEASICKLGITGFNALKALSTKYNDNPQVASRPWDEGRDGFVMGEGSAILVLEEYEHAKKRGAKIYCELAGYGATGDAYHLTAPRGDALGASNAMKVAIKKSGLSLEDIQYINAHGTSTPLGDEIEILGVKNVFGDCKNIVVSSTKSATGHLLGAAGAVEAVFSILSLKNGVLLPTLNLENISEDCKGIDLVPKEARQAKLKAVISNSFGFGGCNASLLFNNL